MDTKPVETPAAALRRKLDEPVLNPILKQWVGRGEMEYERYLHTKTIFSLQLPEAERISHDELMFQIVHQSQELWLKLLSHEIAKVVEHLDADDLWEASQGLERCTRIARTLSVEIGVIETLTPDAYQTLRHHLGNGSGQESPGFNMARVAGEGLEACVDRLLERRGLSAPEAYLGKAAPDVKRVFEQIVDTDEGYQTWLFSHFMLVRRTIGVDRSVKALDGIPTAVLAGRMTQPLVRKLWDARLEMTHGWKREAGFLPGAPRPAGGGSPEGGS